MRCYCLRFLATTILVLGAGLSPALADPVITGLSGEFEDGSTLIIYGNGFGTKNPALPKLWDNFEGHPVGTDIGDPVVGNYTQAQNVQYSSDAPYAGSRCAHSHITPDSEGKPGLISHWIPTEAVDSFCAMKFKIISSAGSIEPHNIKLLRLNGHAPDPTHGYPNYNIGNERGHMNFSGIVNHGLQGQKWFGSFSVNNTEVWNSLLIYDHMGDPDVENGFAGRIINGNYSKGTDIMTLQSGHFDGIRSSFFCAYLSHEGETVELYLDDLYADVTLSRVMVFSDSGNYELQLPVAWNDNSIEIVCNQGQYSSGQFVKLVVYDAQDRASNALNFTIGEGGADPGPPGPAGQPIPE